LVEFKGEFYNIPASKIGPKPIQKPYPLIYLRLEFKSVPKDSKQRCQWLAGIHWLSLEYLQTNIRILKDKASRSNKNKNDFRVFVLTYPQTNFKPSITCERIPLTGTIDQIGNDIQKIKEMEVDHIIFCYLFSMENKNPKKMIYLTK
jgi:hypothetical protein